MEDYLSVFDMLKVGIGPSSSHTLGPWLAAKEWIEELSQSGQIKNVVSLKIRLYGSLALTGKGHFTDQALLLGLAGKIPESVPLQEMDDCILQMKQAKKICLNGLFHLSFDQERDIIFLKSELLPFHPNGMKFEAICSNGELLEATYYSLGGGFILKEGESRNAKCAIPPYPSFTPSQLSVHCEAHQLCISDLVLENEKTWRTETEIKAKLLNIWQVMKDAAFKGCHTEGVLPGGLNVKRRAAELNQQLLRVHNYADTDEWIQAMKVGNDFRKVLTRVSCIALAVNEVNASMGRIVTAPTNGSAGVIPAVLFYYLCFSGKQVAEDDIVRFLLVAAEIGTYFKRGATISAAVGGCQAEIGVSSSMAAAALTERLGGTVAQVLMAAEIAAEHHLGLTCDPVGGLVQIPCIERNSMGAVKAITACMIALSSDPARAKVSLGAVIQSMKETATHMSEKYKETSLGGLAISVIMPEC